MMLSRSVLASLTVTAGLLLFTRCAPPAGPGGGGHESVDEDGGSNADSDADSDGDSDADSDSTSSLCDAAAAAMSYIGCEYYGVTLANSDELPLDEFHYAIAVANDNDVEAHLTVEDGAEITHVYTVGANDMIIIDDLPWKAEIAQAGNAMLRNFATRKVANAAYRLTSDAPVTAYQFNPLHFASGESFSYSNDASLLLPAHVFKNEYLVMTRPTFSAQATFSGDQVALAEMPGYFAVVGSAAGPSTVEITTTAYTRASDGQSNAVYPSLSPGQTLQVVLQPYDVLQMVSSGPNSCLSPSPCDVTVVGGGFSFEKQQTCCDNPREYDLTGTRILVVDGPNPAVFAGHVMTFVPFDSWAGDHLEEQLFPLETQGTRYVCARNVTQDPGEPTIWRILSGMDGNEISFEPSSVHPATTMDKGEFLELTSFEDFEVSGDGRISIAQFTVGQNYVSSVEATAVGDPSMSFAVPVEQYRADYLFLAPDTFQRSYITVIHAPGAQPLLDGAPISGDTQAITSDFSRTNLEIDSGVHYIQHSIPFAINVLGVASYTSYMYPGGLDLKEVVIE